MSWVKVSKWSELKVGLQIKERLVGGTICIGRLHSYYNDGSATHWRYKCTLINGLPNFDGNKSPYIFQNDVVGGRVWLWR